MALRSHYRIGIGYGLVFAWMIVIFLFSHQPATVSDQQSGFFVDILGSITPTTDTGMLTFFIRKSAHFFSYFVLGMLLYNAIRLHKLKPKMIGLLSIAGVLLYAISDEVHQLYVIGRSGEVRDVLLDTTAGIAGVGVCLVATALLRRAKNDKYPEMC